MCLTCHEIFNQHNANHKFSLCKWKPVPVNNEVEGKCDMCQTKNLNHFFWKMEPERKLCEDCILKRKDIDRVGTYCCCEKEAPQNINTSPAN